MEFNKEKCGVLNVGKNNRNFIYDLDGHWLKSVEKKKDLGVIIDNKFKFRDQCIWARNKANKMLGFIKRNVSYKSKYVIRSLYNSYVRPHLEYCMQAWQPHHEQDLNMLESVQRRATKLIPGLKNKEYKDRLIELNMFSVRHRFLRGDLIEVFKIMNNIDSVNVDNFFEMRGDNGNRGHNFIIKKNNLVVRILGSFHFLIE